MKISIRRRGGFAGNIAVGGELETTELPEEQGRALESAVDRLRPHAG